MSAIINSLLDTDFYKFTMQQVVFKKFPDVEVEYTFKNRTKGIKLDYDTYHYKVLKEVKAVTKLAFTVKDIEYLESLELFSKGYLEFLKTFQLRTANIFLYKEYDGSLGIKIMGTWLNTILWVSFYTS